MSDDNEHFGSLNDQQRIWFLANYINNVLKGESLFRSILLQFYAIHQALLDSGIYTGNVKVRSRQTSRQTDPEIKNFREWTQIRACFKKNSSLHILTEIFPR